VFLKLEARGCAAYKILAAAIFIGMSVLIHKAGNRQGAREVLHASYPTRKTVMPLNSRAALNWPAKINKPIVK